MNTLLTVLQWLCLIFSMITLWLIGDKKKIAFPIGIVCNIFWVWYFILTKSYIVMFTSFMYIVMYIRGWINWSRMEKELVTKKSS